MWTHLSLEYNVWLHEMHVMEWTVCKYTVYESMIEANEPVFVCSFEQTLTFEVWTQVNINILGANVHCCQQFKSFVLEFFIFLIWIRSSGKKTFYQSLCHPGHPDATKISKTGNSPAHSYVSFVHFLASLFLCVTV